MKFWISLFLASCNGPPPKKKTKEDPPESQTTDSEAESSEETTEEDEDEEEAEVEAHPLPAVCDAKSSGKRLVAICFQNIIIGGVSVALVKLRFMEYVKSEVFSV